MATATQVQVSEKPILFSGPMVKAILEGRKTQTRRVVKPQPPKWIDRYERSMSPLHWLPSGEFLSDPSGVLGKGTLSVRSNELPVKCPFGTVGDRLWVRETFYAFGYFNYTDRQTRTGGDETEFVDTTYDLGYSYTYAGTDDAPLTLVNDRFTHGWHKRPSIFIPRHVSRITLEITSVRVERLQEITGRDVLAEGIDNGASNPTMGQRWENMQRIAWEEGWNKINGKRKGCTWADDPFVWVIEFTKL